MKKTVRIGNASGFWGDDLDAFERQLTGGHLDYLTADFLAEVTMSILQKQQKRNPELGYVKDFILVMQQIAPIVKEKNVKIITNAGGNNPLDCAKKIKILLDKMGLSFKIGVVEGDNIFTQVPEWHRQGEAFTNIDTGSSFNHVASQLQSASVYSGMTPLVELLERGVDIIIAGRVADPAMTMAPLAYEFGWAMDDFDKLAAALIAGHALECGAQGSGGNYTDWHKITQWENFGYPIIEMSADGSFVVSKHSNTGGLVNVDSVKEQLLYEIGNPNCYISPDVIADFTAICIEQVCENKVQISQAKGRPPTNTLKASMAYQYGYTALGTIIISGGRSVDKARIFERIFWQRLGLDFENSDTSYVGFNGCHKDLAELPDTNEILLRFSVSDPDKSKIIKFSEKISSLILSGPQGVAVTGGRPRVRLQLRYWPALIDKSRVNYRVKVLDEMDSQWQSIPSKTGLEKPFQNIGMVQMSNMDTNIKLPKFDNALTVKLIDICLARSGDKGDTTNIGLLARSPEIYLFIKEYITAELIKSWFASICKGRVLRYELDNLMSLNFLLEASLNGGGTQSLWIDAQGKTYASALLNQKIEIPSYLIKSIKT